MARQQFRYRIVVEWSDADDCYVARVPALPGLGAHGDTPDEATREAIVAYRAILDVMREDDEPIPAEDIAGEYSGQLRLRMPRSLHAAIARLASVEGISLNQELLALLARAADPAPAGRRKPPRRGGPRGARSRRARRGTEAVGQR